MAEDGGDQNRSEPATPFKLEEARKKGSVAKSTETNAAVALLIALVAATAFTDWGLQRLFRLERQVFLSSFEWSFDIAHLMTRFRTLGETVLFVLSPLLATLFIGTVLSNVLQTGPVFTTHPLIPDFTRINPATGFKRLFSVRSLFEGGKALIKLSVVILVAYFALKALLPTLPALFQTHVSSFPALFKKYSLRLFGDLMIAVVAIALIDLIYTRWEFAKRMRMSPRDLKEEVKRREGDPQIRRRRRQLQREMGQKTAAAKKVKDSDVLITNPEHYAVALKYRREKRPAPEVIAKGAGDLALYMREAAFKSGIPIVPSPRLARDLFKSVPIGSVVETRHYELVASILKWAYEHKKRGTRGAAA